MEQTLVYGFSDFRAARHAWDTLHEIGYDVHFALQVHTDNNDLAGAMEVLQAHGGNWLEYGTGRQPVNGAEAFQSAYGLDSIPIPAHLMGNESEESCRESAYLSGDGDGEYAMTADFAGEGLGGGQNTPAASAAEGEQKGLAANAAEGEPSAFDAGLDPSSDDYSRFDAGIHL